jgi:alpha-ketoglutarate-dependent taurine dioxygenase
MIGYTKVGLPCIAFPNGAPGDSTWNSLVTRLRDESATVLEVLKKRGAILFRGFRFGGAECFEKFASAVCPSLQDYVGGNSPRTRVSGKVFTSTEYSQRSRISLHNEASYLKDMPRYVLFYCSIAPKDRGQTPLADSRRIYEKVDPDVRKKFEERRVKYINNLHSGEGVGRSWQQVFQTDDRRTAERRLDADGYQYEWKDDGGLRTSIVAGAVTDHPQTGQRVWINQAEQWHPSSLSPDARDALASVMPESEFPHNSTFGDGTPFDEQDLAHIREIMNQEETSFDWAAEDVLFCDNYLVMHGRQPFTGPRKILCVLG